MLELRPTCEHCNTALPPDSTEARICSFECTFCASCADGLLGNVCPNCGGGFVPRPIRDPGRQASRSWATSSSAIALEIGKPGCLSSQKNSPTGLSSRNT